MPEIALEALPFEEAIEAFKGLVPLTADEFYALAAEARAAAFTVAGVMQMDVLFDMHDAVERAIAKGETLADFRNKLDEIFETRGWMPPENLTPWRMETIFRTNVQTAYQTGRYKQMISQQKDFPFWEYDAVNDSRTREDHAALDGKVYPANHPFWDRWYPPNGFNCRCGVNPVSKFEAEGERIETEMPGGTPDPGWDRNPARERWEPDLSRYPEELRKQFEGRE